MPAYNPYALQQAANQSVLRSYSPQNPYGGYQIAPPQTQYAPDSLYGAMASVMNNQNTNQTQYNIAEGNANAEMARLMQNLLFNQGQTIYRTGYEDTWNQRQNDTQRYLADQNLSGQLGVADRNLQGQLGVAGINSQTALGTAGINAGAQNYATDAQRQIALGSQQNAYNIANLQNQGGITQAQIAANASTVPAYLRQDRFNSVLPLLQGLFYGPNGAPAGTTQGSPGMVNAMQAPPPQMPLANTNQPSANVDTSGGHDQNQQMQAMIRQAMASQTQRPAPVASPTNRPTQAFNPAPTPGGTLTRNVAQVPANYTPRPGVPSPGASPGFRTPTPAAAAGPVPTGRPTMPASMSGVRPIPGPADATPPQPGRGPQAASSPAASLPSGGAYITPQSQLSPLGAVGGPQLAPPEAGAGVRESGAAPAPGGQATRPSLIDPIPVKNDTMPFGMVGGGPVAGGLPGGTAGPGAPGGGMSPPASPFDSAPPPAAASASPPPGYVVDERGRTVRDRSPEAGLAQRTNAGSDGASLMPASAAPPPATPAAPAATTDAAPSGGGLIGGGGILGLLGGSSSSSGGAPVGNQPTIQYAPPSTPQMWQQQVNQEIGRNAASMAAQNSDAVRSMAARYGANSPALQSILNQNNARLAGLNQQARVGIPMQGQQAFSNYLLNQNQALENQYANRQREALQRNQISVGSIAPLLNAIAGFAG